VELLTKVLDPRNSPRERLAAIWRRIGLSGVSLIFLAVIFSLVFFYNTILGLTPSFTVAVDFRAAGILLTVEGVLFGLSPQIDVVIFRALAIGVALISLLYSVTAVMVLDVYQNLLPSSHVVIFTMNLALIDVFRIDLGLFIAMVYIYAAGAIFVNKRSNNNSKP